MTVVIDTYNVFLKAGLYMYIFQELFPGGGGFGLFFFIFRLDHHAGFWGDIIWLVFL